MTTEDDFQRALDANPDDHHTRLVFADWLQERGDERAEGYRELGHLRLYPCHFVERDMWYFGVASNPHAATFPRHALPTVWFGAVESTIQFGADEEFWRYRKTRRELDDDAAAAYRRAKLLQEAALC